MVFDKIHNIDDDDNHYFCGFSSIESIGRSKSRKYEFWRMDVWLDASNEITYFNWALRICLTFQAHISYHIEHIARITEPCMVTEKLLLEKYVGVFFCVFSHSWFVVCYWNGHSRSEKLTVMEQYAATYFCSLCVLIDARKRRQKNECSYPSIMNFLAAFPRYSLHIVESLKKNRHCYFGILGIWSISNT